MGWDRETGAEVGVSSSSISSLDGAAAEGGAAVGCEAAGGAAPAAVAPALRRRRSSLSRSSCSKRSFFWCGFGALEGGTSNETDLRATENVRETIADFRAVIESDVTRHNH